MRSIMVTGVPGVGKSAIARCLAQTLGLPVKEYSDYILAVLGTRDRNDIRHLSFTDRQSLYHHVNDVVRAKFQNGREDDLAILVNHLSICLDGNVNTFEVDYYQIYNMAALVIVEAAPELVVELRGLNPQRVRHMETEELIARQQATNGEVGRAIRARLGTPVLTAVNRRNRLPDALICTWLQDNCITTLPLPPE